jgi:NAD(P)-dependent dehydrogenase (short-subunit alcohol dehydrogenase family)
VADLSRRGAAADLADAAVDALGGVDILINNAGTTCHGLQWVVGDRDEGRDVFETNLWSPLALTAALAPQMLERGSGTIVNVTSLVQVSPYPALSHYCASKAALGLATETLRLEAEPAGIQVTEVLLGPVDTPGSTEQRLLPGGEEWLERTRLGTADAAARAIAAGIERGRDRIVYPRTLRIAYALPGLGRRYARRMGKSVDPSDTSVRRGGSSGDERNRALREEWESRGRRE